VVQRLENLSRIVAAILPKPQTSEAERGSQLPEQSALLLGDLKRFKEAGFGRRYRRVR
jgi:hypothetical protein